ncbi:MAG TPA: HAD family hydrolase [Candidatus Limnocylindria bacterium]|nr:HAD family hydrolase [Candidatus Limnocylindria bacterium]
MPLKAAFFDVGDTLVEHWAPREKLNALAGEVLRREFGEREWYERFLQAEFGPNARSLTQLTAHPPPSEEELRQETIRWYREWFHNSQIGIDDIDVDRLRIAVVVPLDLVSTLVPGAPEALRWCKANGLRVVLVTNTLARGDAEALDDWKRFGLADAIDGIVTSHTIGWQKPHRAIFERALQIADAMPHEAFMVGDRLDADIFGAKRVGMRAVLRRTEHEQLKIDVTPDAVVDDLTELPAVVAPWLGVGSTTH